MTQYTAQDASGQEEKAVPPPGAPSSSSSGQEGGKVDKIKARIERTEARLDEALTAIQDRLSLNSIIEQAEEKILETTVMEAEEMMKKADQAAGKIGKTLAATLREYPISTSLVGVALTWFLYKGVTGSEEERVPYRESSRYPMGARSQFGEEEMPEEEALYQSGLEETGGYRYGEDAEYGSGSYVGSTFSKARDLAESAQEKTIRMTGNLQEKASDIAGTFQEKAADIAGTVQEKASDIARGALEKGKQLTSAAGFNVGEWNRSSMGRSIKDNALTIGILAAGIGLGIGLLLPASRIESELMGEKQEGLLRSARQFGERATRMARTILLTGEPPKREEREEDRPESIHAPSVEKTVHASAADKEDVYRSADKEDVGYDTGLQ